MPLRQIPCVGLVLLKELCKRKLLIILSDVWVHLVVPLLPLILSAPSVLDHVIAKGLFVVFQLNIVLLM